MDEEDLVHLEGLVVGLSLPAACDILESFRCPWRLSKVDGEAQVLIMNFNSGRFNLEVEGGKVTGVSRG